MWTSLTVNLILAFLLGGAMVGSGWISSFGDRDNLTARVNFQREELIAIRKFSERLAAGDSPKAALSSVSSDLFETGSWIHGGHLRIRLEGDKLVKVCGAGDYGPDTCSGGIE